MIKPKFEDFDYGVGRKDLSWCQYAKALEEYVTFLETKEPALRQSLVVGRSESFVCDVCGSTDVIEAPHMGRNCNRCHPL